MTMQQRDPLSTITNKIQTGSPTNQCSSCGTKFTGAYLSKLKLHPFQDNACLNPKCKMKHQGVPPDLVRSHM